MDRIVNGLEYNNADIKTIIDDLNESNCHDDAIEAKWRVGSNVMMSIKNKMKCLGEKSTSGIRMNATNFSGI